MGLFQDVVQNQLIALLSLPFWLQELKGQIRNGLGLELSPLQIFRFSNDDFQFIGQGINGGFRGTIAVGRLE